MQLGPKQDVERLRLGIGPLVGWLIRVTPTCQEMTRLLSDEMDRPLPWKTRAKMRLHFLICKWCERYKNQLRFLRQAVRRHPEQISSDDPATPSLSSEAKDRLKRTLRER
ncbi:MAG: zf-HC2 domain-containing protein [Nitrospiraceae bacterium]|nr:zf-HC2 domain-containing protein [Nitrospiraceae bacterium]